MALKTSLVIAGDASGAEAALNSVDQGMEANKAQAEAMAKSYAAADAAIVKLSNAQALAKRETDATKAAFAAGELTLEQYNRELLETKSALSLVEAEHRAAMTGLRQNSQALNDNTVSLGQARAGYTNFGRQIQDVAVMAKGGANIGTIISTQGGQIADAVAQMGGRFSGFAAFMAGPWGTAVLLASSVLIDNLIPALFDTSDAADDTKGKVLDLSGGISALENNAASAAEAMADLRKEMDKSSKQTEVSTKATVTMLSGMGELARINGEIKQAEGLMIELSRSPGGAQAMEGMVQRLASLESQRATVQKTIDQSKKDLDELSWRADAARMQAAADEHNGNKPKSSKSKKTGPSAATLAELGEDAGKKIANIRDQFSNIPSEIERSNKALRSLDDIASDIERRQPPNYKELKPALEEARKAVQDSLIRPYNEFLEKAREAQQIDLLLAAGRDDEAEALKVVLSLQEHMDPLTKDQLDTVLETVRAERQRAMVIRDQRALIQANINAVHDLRGALEQTVAGMFRGKFSIKGIIASIGNSYVQIASQRIVEAMFGDTLRALEEQASGRKSVETAGKEMAEEMKKGSAAVTDFATAVRLATDKVNGTSTASGSTSSGSESGPSAGEVSENQIEVIGQRPSANFAFTMTNELLRTFGIKLPKQITDLFGSTLNKLEVSLPQVIQGALSGATASRMLLGDSGSGLGGAIGGAIGQKVGEKFLSKGLESIASGLGQFAGPIGSIAGGLIGGAIGGLFKKAKWGTSVLTGQGEGDISTDGNKAAYRRNSSGAAGSVQDMISQIADQLGGDASGAYNVSIGQYKGKWRVSTTGYSGKLNFKGNTGATGKGLYDFGKDGAEEAAMFAALDAIGDGAIKGLSAAVQKALKSSTDINKAVQEALKVQEVELAIGGIGAELEKAFKDFERQAQERVRIAKEYGFDVVAIEEKNNEDRLKLTKQLLDQQVGSLQSLIDEMTAGSLFEGSAVDQRNALLDQIAQTRQAAANGEDGAADKLATLLEQLNSVSRDAYGTTGGFASDRDLILDAARDTIAQANQRVAQAEADAAKASDPALETTNAALDENNDQNAKILAELANSNQFLAKIVARFAQTDLSNLVSLASVKS